MTTFLLLTACFTILAEEPGSRLDQARAILKASKAADNERDGRAVIQLLTAGRQVEELSRDELLVLATANNWAGQKGDQLKAADLVLKKNPRDAEGLKWKANALCNLASGKRTSEAQRKQEIAFYEECVRVEKDKSYWLVRKAVALCQGSVETRIGLRGEVEPEVITDKDAYEKAFVALHEAFTVNPKLKEGPGAIYFVDFFLGDHFPRLHREERFNQLLDGKYRGS